MATTGSASLNLGSIKVTGGTSSQFLKADGSVDSSTYLVSGSSPYDLAGFISGKPSNSANLLVIPIVRATSIASSGHQGKALTAATGSTVLTFSKNGSSIGTATWAASGTVPTWSITATSFAAGDYLTVTNQATADSTLSDIGFTLSATA